MDSDEVIIEPVGWRTRRRAMRVLVAGGAGGDEAADRAWAISQALAGKVRKAIWWARDSSGPLAVAVLLAGAGRAGSLLHTPLEALGQRRDVLARLLNAVATKGLARGLCLVQAMTEQPGPMDDVLTEARFGPLAKLIYMKLPLKQAPVAPAVRSDLRLLSWRHNDQRRLEQLIQRTYVDSLDCPGLCGVRTMRDVLDAHRSAGRFRPQSWWICQRDGQDAGCVLVNAAADGPDAELVYLGLVPEHRRMGVGRWALEQALQESRLVGRRAMLLAVDAANTPAVRLYQRLGFQSRASRNIWIFTADSLAGGRL